MNNLIIPMVTDEESSGAYFEAKPAVPKSIPANSTLMTGNAWESDLEFIHEY